MVIGLGTAALGRPQYINIKQDVAEELDLQAFKKNGFKVLEEAYEQGIRYFDTAPGYGLAEQLLIEWLQTKSDPTITVATKWGYTYMANFDPNAKVHEIKEHSVSKLIEQWEVSQTLLPYLSVYQIHSASFETGVLDNQEVLNKLASLKNDNNLKIGLTTTGDNQSEVIEKAANIQVSGVPLFEVFQSTYNILDQSILNVALELIKEGRQFVLKETLANGRLFPNKNYPNYKELYDYMEKLSTKYNIGVDAIALKFCIQTFPESLVLSGANKTSQLLENLNANTFSLSNEEVSQLATFKVLPSNYWQERKQLTWH
ncbi:aldo/keto reductase [Seonamhaeicola sp. ML3]|uniref:aldo/keto reductase n=1 Tax=Seonamhaeicola sp. ML3 TaxID=2937786 RepID=UPI0020104CEB|nr:aldo/keto reductase [Seonamhaeicola sp. ML3]